MSPSCHCFPKIFSLRGFLVGFLGETSLLRVCSERTPETNVPFSATQCRQPSGREVILGNRGVVLLFQNVDSSADKGSPTNRRSSATF